MIRVCPHCATANRVPVRFLVKTGRCGACHETLPPLAQPVDVNEADFDAIVRDASVPVLVDFWAAWCGPCKMAAPEVAKLAQQQAGQAIVLKVNTEENPGLAARFSVRSIPYFAVFSGGELRQQRAGLMGQQQLEQMLSAA